MYQINGNTVSFRVNEEEREQINQMAEMLQKINNQVYANGNQLFFALLEYCKQLEIKAKENSSDSACENELKMAVNTVNEYRKQLSTAVNVVYEDENMSDDQLLTTVINVINEKPKEVEVEVFKEKEVEKEIADNQILITITDNTERKFELLKEISLRRAKRYKREPETIDELCEKMIFNESTIFNLGGEFFTGF